MQSQKQKSIESLRTLLKPGDTVHTILRHVSRSGMMRHISLVVIRDGDTRHINYDVAKALDYKLVNSHGYDALKVQGCGMDMGFAVVYDLGRVLFPQGFDTPPGYVRNEPLSHDSDGGYALTHHWL